jgi:stearoyl-CoA desaturase (delta-9 desaturase)
LARYEELMWLDRHPYLPAALLASTTWLVGSWPGPAIGFCWSTVAVNWLLALLTMGEGWPNNHRAYPASARQGFHWWEYDPTYYILRVLSWLGIVWDLHHPPRAVIKREHRPGRVVINKVADQLAASFPIRSHTRCMKHWLAHRAGRP